MMNKYYSLVVFGNNKRVNLKKLNRELELQKSQCLEFFKNQIEININFLDSTITSFSEINKINNLLGNLKGDVLILLKIEYYPKDSWLKNIITSFDKSHHSILIGKITENNLLFNWFKQDKNNQEDIVNEIEKYIGNCALKKSLIEPILCLKSAYNEREKSCYKRIFREVETEILYLENVKVVKL
ncbi:hypothetical protein [Cyanobacterium aponinum]|uniref:hypothetical protein n=1 Tax=Cyanobacterium aponinum TaxID=379064 RepID=UPI0010561B1B|nr:hypothetical protein [Cyanobacterium aponinum]